MWPLSLLGVPLTLETESPVSKAQVSQQALWYRTCCNLRSVGSRQSFYHWCHSSSSTVHRCTASSCPIEPPHEYIQRMFVTNCLKNHCYKCCQTQLQYMRAHVEHTLLAGVESSHHFKGPGRSVLFIIGVECSKLFLHIFCLRMAGIHISHL